MGKKWILICVAVVFLLSGCGTVPIEVSDTSDIQEQTTSPTAFSEVQTEGTSAFRDDLTDISGLFSDRDLEGTYDESNAVFIRLNGSSASCEASSVEINESEITIREEGVFILSGSLDDGMIIVDTDKKSKVQLVLDGASIHSENYAPIYILQADKVFLTLAEGSENNLSSGGSFLSRDGNDIDAVIYSKDDLTMNGGGSLSITSPGGHGVVSKDELTITGGSYTITCASHGLSGKDSVAIAGGSFTIDSGKDSIQADNDDTSLGYVYIRGGTFSIRCEGDGISASSTLQLDGGSFQITAGGGSANGEQHTSEDWGRFGGGPGGGRGGFGGNQSASSSEDSTSVKALKASGELVINGGSYVIDSADDAVHSNKSITVNGGDFSISTGDDGFHADEDLTVRAGSIVITESYEGLEGLTITVSGGSISLTSSDDGLNAAGGTDQSGFGGHRGGDMFAASSDSFITISGGSIFMDASGDGIDSNGDLTISGGSITVEGPTDNGNGSLDYGGSGVISGGTLVVTGSVGMAQSIASSGGQGVLAVSTGNLTGGTAVTVSDSAGNTLLSFTPRKSYSCVIVSCPEMISGESYTISIGEVSQEFTAK